MILIRFKQIMAGVKLKKAPDNRSFLKEMRVC
jgi:hypothetical protein